MAKSDSSTKKSSFVRSWLSSVKDDKAIKTNDDDGVSPTERRYNVAAAISFVVLMAFIGVPSWWLTTRVYRASLPYGEISTYEYSVLVLPVSVSLVVGDETVYRLLHEKDVVSKVETEISKEFYRLKISLDLSERQSSEAEKSILTSQFGSFAELESALYVSSISMRGRSKIHTQDLKGDGLEIFILHRPREKIRIHFGTTSRIFIVGDVEDEQGQPLSDLLIDLILHGYLRLDELLGTISRHTKENIQPVSNRTTGNSLSTGVLNPKMTLEMHIVDPEPILCAQRFSAERIVDDEMVKGFLTSIRQITDINVKSQMLYNIEFPHEPIRDEKRAFFYLDPAQLQHTINPIETYLGTVVTTEPVYHMLLYLPPTSVRPLMIVDEKLNPASYNSFVVSGWGSVTVVNLNRTCLGEEKISMDDRSMKSMKMAFIANLRKYFGLQLSSDLYEQSTTVALADWEVQSLRYRAVVEYAFSSMRSLKSLTKLLGEINNIVINDDIAASIETAVSEMNIVLNQEKNGNRGGHWKVHSMLKSATKAFEEAEKAFFDPSLLAMLYFPDEQKYAIYVPLFLPIGVPVIGSIMFIYKYFKVMFKKEKKE